MKNGRHGYRWIFYLVGVLLLCLICIIIAIVALTVKNRNEYKTQISLGDKYLAEMDYENAVLAYQNAIQIDHKKDTAYLQLAEVYLSNNEYDLAVQVLSQNKMYIADADYQECQKRIQDGQDAYITAQREEEERLKQEEQERLKQEAEQKAQEEAEAAKKKSKEPLAYTMESDSQDYTAADGIVYFEYTYEMPVVSGDTDAVSKINNAINRLKEEFLGEAIREEAELSNALNYPEYHVVECQDDLKIEITYNKNGILSVKSDRYCFLGGPHPSERTIGETYDTKTGEKIDLMQFISADQETFRSVAIQYFEQSYLDDKFSDMCMNNIRTADQITSNYYLTEDGLVLKYNSDEVGPHAGGRPEAMIPYTDTVLAESIRQ